MVAARETSSAIISYWLLGLWVLHRASVLRPISSPWFLAPGPATGPCIERKAVRLSSGNQSLRAQGEEEQTNNVNLLWCPLVFQLFVFLGRLHSVVDDTILYKDTSSYLFCYLFFDTLSIPSSNSVPVLAFASKRDDPSPAAAIFAVLLFVDLRIPTLLLQPLDSFDFKLRAPSFT